MTARFNQLFSWSHVATTRFGNALEQSNVTVAASDDVAIKAATRARSVERMAGILVKTTTREEFRGEEEERGDGRALFFGFKRPFACYISHLAQPGSATAPNSSHSRHPQRGRCFSRGTSFPRPTRPKGQASKQRALTINCPCRGVRLMRYERSHVVASAVGASAAGRMGRCLPSGRKDSGEDVDQSTRGPHRCPPSPPRFPSHSLLSLLASF